MLRTIAVLAIATIALAGCKKEEETGDTAPAEETATAPKEETAPAEPTEPEAEAEAVIEIVPGTVHIAPAAGAEGEATSIELREGGQVAVGDEVQATLTPDGKVHDASGQLLASIDDSGTVTLPGETETITIGEDGTIEKGGEVLASIGDDGMLGGAMAQQVKEKIHFEAKPEGRRALAYVFLVATMAGQQAEAGEAAEAN